MMQIVARKVTSNQYIFFSTSDHGKFADQKIKTDASSHRHSMRRRAPQDHKGGTEQQRTELSRLGH